MLILMGGQEGRNIPMTKLERYLEGGNMTKVIGPETPNHPTRTVIPSAHETLSESSAMNRWREGSPEIEIAPNKLKPFRKSTAAAENHVSGRRPWRWSFEGSLEGSNQDDHGRGPSDHRPGGANHAFVGWDDES